MRGVMTGVQRGGVRTGGGGGGGGCVRQHVPSDSASLSTSSMVMRHPSEVSLAPSLLPWLMSPLLLMLPLLPPVSWLAGSGEADGGDVQQPPDGTRSDDRLVPQQNHLSSEPRSSAARSVFGTVQLADSAHGTGGGAAGGLGDRGGSLIGGDGAT